MNTGATLKMFRFSWLVLVVLVLGVLTVQEAGAIPNRPFKTIGQRVKITEENCEDLGGSLNVSYSYEGDDLVSANTSCKGGGMDGQNCTFTADTTTCYNEPRRVTADKTGVQSDGIPAGVASEPGPAVPTVGTRTNVDGSGDGTVAGLSTAPAPATTGPAMVMLVEDEREP